MYEVFYWSFIILSILNPIGDFMTSRRRFKGEFWIVANPLHWWWDSSRFRTHQHFMRGNYKFKDLDRIDITYNDTSYLHSGDRLSPDYSYIYNVDKTNNESVTLLYSSFWKHLGKDQLAHVLLNLLCAAILQGIWNVIV